MKWGDPANRTTSARTLHPNRTPPAESDTWGNVISIPTRLMRDWVRRRLMDSRIAGRLSLDALRDLFTARDDEP